MSKYRYLAEFKINFEETASYIVSWVVHSIKSELVPTLYNQICIHFKSGVKIFLYHRYYCAHFSQPSSPLASFLWTRLMWRRGIRYAFWVLFISDRSHVSQCMKNDMSVWLLEPLVSTIKPCALESFLHRSFLHICDPFMGTLIYALPYIAVSLLQRTRPIFLP